MSAGPYARREEVQRGDFRWALVDSTRQSMMAATGLPFTWFSHTLHDQQENVMTRLYNDIRLSNNRPKFVTLGMTNKRKELAWSMTAGATNWLEPGETVEFIPTSPDQASLMPVLQQFSQLMATNRIPLSAFGQAAAQTSGYAMENQNETGRERLSGYLQTKANFRRLRFERRLRYAARHGRVLGDPNAEGMVELPFRKPKIDQPGTFLLTPQILEETGTRLDVRMTNLPRALLGPLGNSVKMWRDMGLMDKVEALELREDEDPEGTIHKVDLEMVMDDPLLKFPKMVKRLIADEDMLALQFVLSEYKKLKAQEQIEEMMTQGGPPQIGPGDGSMASGGQTLPPGPGGPPTSGPANVPGLSLPGLGMPPGQSPGRPPGQPMLPGL
jgi:hypothetical protein